MSYVSFDLETTSLDPEKGQILSLAMVFNKPELPINECPYIYITFPWESIYGDVGALAMNAELIDLIARGETSVGTNGAQHSLRAYQASVIDKVTFCVEHWLECLHRSGGKLNLLGCQVGSFDYQWMKKHLPQLTPWFDHRMLDVTSLYATVEGMQSVSKIPNLADIVARHQLVGKAHNALYDARLALALAREKWGV